MEMAVTRISVMVIFFMEYWVFVYKLIQVSKNMDGSDNMFNLAVGPFQISIK